ncbi:SURF1 family protein [Jannaschia formosa]|uniref:SURF1 family protein n=1 Tax=Jannaschia formosa TaxID=2259592 RepID=UPI00351F8C0A
MRFVLPLLFGLAGFAVLVSLGVWQLQRLEWKEGVIDRIESRIGADPVPLPEAPDPEADDYRPVTLTGTVSGSPLRVLGAWRGGTGFRVVAPVETGDRTVLVDFGIVPLEGADTGLPVTMLEVTGNLVWPEESNAATPAPDGDVWFARDVGAMAEVLNAEPLLVVARSVTPPAGPAPAPVGTGGIPNSHLGYAIQWFGLALVWAGMTLFLLWRIRRRTV